MLISRVEANRGDHRAVVEDALDKYRELVIAELDTMIRDAKAGKKIRRYIQLVEPEDHTRDYDRVLDMLKMSVEDTIQISERDFARYVRDEWEWKEQWAASNKLYSNSHLLDEY